MTNIYTMSTSEQLRIPVQSILQHLGLWEEAGLHEGKNWNLCLEKNNTWTSFATLIAVMISTAPLGQRKQHSKMRV